MVVGLIVLPSAATTFTSAEGSIKLLEWWPQISPNLTGRVGWLLAVVSRQLDQVTYTYPSRGVNYIAVHHNDVVVTGAFNVAGNKPSVQAAIWHEAPTLSISKEGGNVRLSWPASFDDVEL